MSKIPLPPKPIVGVHLDLKGMNFKPAYIPQLMADLASQGVNAVLVEYEDIFPFRSSPAAGNLDIALDRSVVWSRATLSRFLAEAKRNRIEVIPLQQCLGHLEYLLGWKRFRSLAENTKYPSTIRLDSPRAVALVSEMLSQIIAAHPGSRYIHLGMDEAHALHDAAKRLKRSVLDLFLDHLHVLLKVVEPTGKIPMIWTDMLWNESRFELADALPSQTVLVHWHYRGGGPFGGAKVRAACKRPVRCTSP